MKQLAKIIAVAFAIVATAAACQKAELRSERNLTKIIVSAQLPQTKADIQTDGKVFWQSSDKIAVYVEGKRFVLTLADGAGTGEAIFEGEVEVEAGTDIVITNAIYPAESAGATYKFRIGGVVGHFQSANSLNDAKYSVYKSMFDGNIIIAGTPGANTSYIGGIAGYSQSNIHIRSCTNLGSIKMTAAQKYQFNVGGIIGQLGSSGNGVGAVISDCRNGIAADPEADRLIDLTVIGGPNTSSTTYAYLGGIAGMCYATISYCFNYANIGFSYATKEPAGGKGSPRMGGICGYLTKDQPMTMDNCANFGTVYNGFVNNTRTNVGNLIGYGQASTGIIKNCLCAGNGITEGATRAAGERIGIIVGCQAASATYGTETEPIYILKGIKITYSYTAGAVETVIDEDNYETKLEGKPTASNVYHTALVSTVEEGMSKLVDRYAE